MTGLVKFDGWDLDASSASAPRVLDLDVATRGGMKRPRDVRTLIKRNAKQLARYGELRQRDSVQRYETRPGVWQQRTVQEYWLNEGQAYALVALMRSDVADDLRFQLVSMFLAYRDTRLAPPAVVDLAVVHGPRVGDVPNLRRDMSQLCAMVARASGATLRKVHGYLRHAYRVPGVHHISTAIWALAKGTLEDIALGRIQLAPPSRRALPVDRRQLDMWKSN